jgi:hypothetical protein
MQPTQQDCAPRTKRITPFVGLAKFAIIGALTLTATSASAFGIGAIVLKLVLKDAVERVINLAIHQVFDDNRSAVAVAAVPTAVNVDKQHSNWFHSAVALAAVADDWGQARGDATNSLGTKIAKATGEDIFASAAYIAWKGDIKLGQIDIGVGPDSALLNYAVDPLPLPEDVVSASYQFTWTTKLDDIGFSFGKNDANHGGSLAIDLAINDTTVFSGAAHSVLGALPVFEGDLMGYAGSFTTTLTSAEALDLTLTGNYQHSIDYAAFYANPEIDVAVAGAASDNANGVPEPAAWAMMIFGFGLIGARQRHQRAINPVGV